MEGQAVSVRRAILPFSRVDLSARQTVTTMLDIPLTHLIQARPRVDILQTLHRPQRAPRVDLLNFPVSFRRSRARCAAPTLKGSFE